MIAEAPSKANRILLVSWGLPPAVAGSAVIVRHLASQFDSDELVLAGECPASVSGSTAASLPHRTYYLTRQRRFVRRGRRYLNYLRWASFPIALRRLSQIIRREKCTIVLAVFPDEFYMAVAYYAARRTGCRFFSYFHNTYLDNRTGVNRWFASWLQPKVFAASEKVFVMSAGMKEEWERLYPGIRIHVATHTFYEPVQSFEPLPGINPRRLQLGFMGSISDANLDALHRMCHLVNESDDLELTLLTPMPEWYLTRQGCTGDRIRYEQPADEDLLKKLRANDILFLPHGLTGGLAPIEYRTIFPTRTVPYLLSGRPILAHSPPESFLTRWLKQHDCAEVVEFPDATLLRTAIERLRDNARRREQLVKNALNAVRQFRVEDVVNSMKQQLYQMSA